jgi:hypothetical protein
MLEKNRHKEREENFVSFWQWRSFDNDAYQGCHQIIEKEIPFYPK